METLGAGEGRGVGKGVGEGVGDGVVPGIIAGGCVEVEGEAYVNLLIYNSSSLS